MAPEELALWQCSKAKARREDHCTSHEAARGVERSGVAGRQRAACYDAVCNEPGMTGREIEELLGFKAHKRLPELRDDGIIHNGKDRKCRVGLKKCLTWWPGGGPDPWDKP